MCQTYMTKQKIHFLNPVHDLINILQVDMLGMFLGLVMMCMIVLFFVVVYVMGLDFKK